MGGVRTPMRAAAPSPRARAVEGSHTTVRGHDLSRRLACPSVAEPLQTGDGWLARLPAPIRPLSLESWSAILRAARRYGNGVLELTTRGGLQVRGLTQGSGAGLARMLRAAGVEDPGVPVLQVNPLSGLDPCERIDAAGLADRVRTALVESPLRHPLGPKVSVVVDGGGSFPLDGVSADVRVEAVPGPRGVALRISAAGTASTAVAVGQVSLENGPHVVHTLLERIAAAGRAARARSVVDACGPEALARGLPIESTHGDAAAPRAAAEPLGVHPIRGGCAVGLGLPLYGSLAVSTLESLLRAVRDAGGQALQACPGRALLVLPIPAARVSRLQQDAADLGFLVHGDDPRRHVVACAGAPACGSALHPTRDVAAEIATSESALLDGSMKVHVSGCTKGCAHPGTAALTLVADPRGYAVVLHGTASGLPVGVLPVSRVAEGTARLLQQAPRGSTSAERLAGIAPGSLAPLFAELADA